MNKLSRSFYEGNDVLQIAKQLLGKILVTQFNNIYTAGRIVETEAYAGEIDKASHAYGGRRTNRTEVMFGAPATSYVYLCYGIHHLFNVVTNRQGIPHAVLIRALEPISGIEDMLIRADKKKADFTLTKGPGNVSKVMGIRTSHTGISLLGDQIYITDNVEQVDPNQILSTPRIGVDYAGPDALLPYRFIIKNNPYVTGKKIFNSGHE